MGQITIAGNNQSKFALKSIVLPHLSAYTHIFGELYYNRTPLASLGTGIVIHNSSTGRTSW